MLIIEYAKFNFKVYFFYEKVNCLITKKVININKHYLWVLLFYFYLFMMKKKR